MNDFPNIASSPIVKMPLFTICSFMVELYMVKLPLFVIFLLIVELRIVRLPLFVFVEEIVTFSKI